MDKNIFRVYDIRGKYPKEINEEAVAEIIPAIINILKPKIIVVGHDTRLSSPNLYRATINSIKRQVSNIKFIKIGTATTPMFYFLVNKLKADGGIMITASHNPKEYNGLKIVGKNAAPISGKEILKWII
ncbi:MAG: hypothetical protein AAB366_03000 [Patescibacteria group bacterium]